MEWYVTAFSTGGRVSAFSVCMDVSSQDTSALWKKESFQLKYIKGDRGL